MFVAIAGLPPLGIFMSEFLVVSSTFAREPWLASILALGILVALGGLFLRLNSIAFGAPRGPTAKAEASYVPMFLHLALVLVRPYYHARSSGEGLWRCCRETVGVAMGLLDTISGIEIAESHRPWPRVLVSGEGWRRAMAPFQLAALRYLAYGLTRPRFIWGCLTVRTVMLRSSVTRANPANFPVLARIMRLRSGWNAPSMTYLVSKR